MYDRRLLIHLINGFPGDYFSKLARDRLIGKKIRATAEDLDFTKAAIDKIKKEAVDLVCMHVCMYVNIYAYMYMYACKWSTTTIMTTIHIYTILGISTGCCEREAATESRRAKEAKGNQKYKYRIQFLKQFKWK